MTTSIYSTLLKALQQKISCAIQCTNLRSLSSLNGTNYSRMDQVKFVGGGSRKTIIGGNCLKSEGLGQSADLREAWRKRGGGGGGDVFDMGMLIPQCTLWIAIEHMQFTHTNQIFKYTYTIKKYKKLSQHIEVKQPNLIHKQKKMIKSHFLISKTYDFTYHWSTRLNCKGHLSFRVDKCSQ